MTDGSVLNGRRAILAYLGRTSKSTWFKLCKAGLPHYHEAGRVWALVAELDAWRLQRSQGQGKACDTGIS